MITQSGNGHGLFHGNTLNADSSILRATQMRQSRSIQGRTKRERIKHENNSKTNT